MRPGRALWDLLSDGWTVELVWTVAFPKNPRRVLVVRHRFIGDTLLMVPFLRNLRQALPEAQIDVLVEPQTAELLEGCPYVDNLIPVEPKTVGWSARLQSFWKMLERLRVNRYDVAFVLKRSFSSAFLVWLAGIPLRVGFSTEGRRWLLTHPVPYRMDRHEVESFLDALRCVDLPVTEDSLEAWWTDAESQYAATLLNRQPEERHLGIHLTSSNPAKEWSDTQFAKLALALLTKKKPDSSQTGRTILHGLGLSQDWTRYEQLRARMPHDLRDQVVNHCGKTTLRQSLALIAQLDGLVGVDSGPLHMAAAVGTPVVALFGPMSDQKWHPWTQAHRVVAVDLPCRPCHLKGACPHEYACMKQLSVEAVLDACQTVMP
ncbi:MAG: lipopolysaccharide heptosyltransferase II [Candidatus Melainabacteria bacterium]|nr:lipopolysaccharide heptosyltransferase II [Candidatus Melainabacteria bacterium]